MLNADKHNSRLNLSNEFQIYGNGGCNGSHAHWSNSFSNTETHLTDGKKNYEKNQATSQANACGNGKLPINVFCQNIGSQIQGEENAVA